MVTQRFTNPGLPVVLTGTLLALYACSFQDFSHLQDGAGGGSAGSGKGGAGSGGTSGASGDSGRGGAAGFSGSVAGNAPAGGTSGDEGGQSGDAATSGAPSEGGAPSDGGAPASGSGGMTPAGSSGSGGTLAGNGGDAGEPSDAGEGGEGGKPPLVGNLLSNPGFELGLTGWSVDPSNAVTNRFAYTQAPNPANGTSSSLATWHETQEYSVFIFQKVKGLEPGTYTFKGALSTQATQQAYLFARNCGGDEIDVDIPPVSYEWFEMSIPNIPVSGTSCEVGLFVHGLADVDWLNADGFSFEKDP